MKNFVEASRKKDVEGVKKTLSGSTIKMMEGLAKVQGKTLDQTIKESDAGENEYKEVPEMRNEKIEGDTATLEVKNVKTGEWDTLYFVKETDEWKIALDKSLEEIFKKSLGDWKMPNFDDSTTDGDKPSTEKKP
jgi:flagellar hook-associated protein FlgK